MEILLATNAGSVRRVTRHGREFLVAPLSMLSVGVLSGSQGSLYYPPDEVARHPGLWNGVPIVVGHPIENGQHLSARDPDVLDRSQIGHVYRDRVDGTRRLAEAWIEVEAARRVNPQLLAKIEAGEKVEVSTGLYTENTPGEGEHQGKRYVATARAFRPDHVAVLPSEKGACSVSDGCGLNVNAQGETTDNVFCPTGPGGGQDPSCSPGGGAVAAVPGGLPASAAANALTEKANAASEKASTSGTAADHKAAARAHKQAAEAHYDAKDSIVIAAVRATVRPGDAAAAKFFESRMAAAHGHGAAHADHQAKMDEHKAKAKQLTSNQADDLFPDDLPDPEGGHVMALTPEKKQAIVTGLTVNCTCPADMPWKGKDAAALNALSDDTLSAWDAVRNALATRPAHPPGTPSTPPGTPLPGTPAPGPTPAPVPPTTPPRPQTMKEWQDLAPPEAQAIWNSLVEAANREKAALVERLTANASEAHKPALVALYGTMKPEQLHVLVNALPQQAGGWAAPHGAPEMFLPHYLGAGPVPTTAPEPPRESLNLPVCNLGRETA